METKIRIVLKIDPIREIITTSTAITILDGIVQIIDDAEVRYYIPLDNILFIEKAKE